MRTHRRSTPDTGADAGAPLAVSSTLAVLWPYLTEFPGRVVLAMSLLVSAKLAGVYLPQLLKQLVNALSLKPGQGALLAVPLGLLLAYSGVRFLNVLFGELRDVAFGKVAERAQRRAALRVFEHLRARSSAASTASASCCASACSTSCRPCWKSPWWR